MLRDLARERAAPPFSVMLLALASACVHRSAGPGDTGRLSTVSLEEPIGAKEIAATGGETMYEVIKLLRPDLLQQADPRSTPVVAKSSITVGMLVVYLNGERIGGPDVLKRIPAHDVQEVVWLAPRAAASRFHAGHPKGALLLRTTSGSAGILPAGEATLSGGGMS